MIKKFISLILTSIILITSTTNTEANNPPRLIKNNINGYNVIYSKIDLSHSKITIENNKYSLSGLSGLRNLSKNSYLSINGSYFKPDTGLVIGLYVKNGEIITSPIMNRVSFGMYNNKPIIGHTDLEGQITSENINQPILYINQPIFKPEGATVFNDRYNIRLPKINNNFKYIMIKDNTVVDISSYLDYVPKNSLVIVSSRLGKLVKDSKIEINYNLTGNFKDVSYALSGGTYLIKKGQVYIDYAYQNLSRSFVSARRPRTCIGYTLDNKVILLISTTPVNLYELGKIMKKLGCVEAINLDGGSSTQLKYRNKVYGSGRLITNSINVN